MSSPFPGMDPFLEEPTDWSGTHSLLINSIHDQLADALSPNFFVRIEERVYVTTLETDPEKRPIVPDVYVIKGPAGRSAQATAEAIWPPTLIEPLYDEEIRDRYLEIRDARNREVITTLELLSPYNKASGTQGRGAFLRKRKLVMASNTHWIEVDLLRAGERPQEIAGKSDYYALLKRGGQPPPFEVWFFDLRDKLPTIAVPLRPPFADVPLNLQAAFDDTYTRAHYADAMDYSGDPPLPRLRPADTNWVSEQVREWVARQAR